MGSRGGEVRLIGNIKSFAVIVGLRFAVRFALVAFISCSFLIIQLSNNYFKNSQSMVVNFEYIVLGSNFI